MKLSKKYVLYDDPLDVVIQNQSYDYYIAM